MTKRILFDFKDDIHFDGKSLYKSFEIKHSLLYEKLNYLTPLDSVINKIYEYDMKSAGFSVIKKYKLLSKSVIADLEKMNKKSQREMIGILQINNKKLKKDIPKHIKQIRKLFFEMNNIQEHEVLSIKNDAIFIIGRKLRYTKFDGVDFVIKNTYDIYHQIENFECYYNKREERLDIKGINDSTVEDHMKGICTFIMDCFDYIILGRYDSLRKYLKQFAQDYKSRKLPLIYYKEFNHINKYRIQSELQDEDREYVLISPHYDSSVKADLNIAFNYLYFVLPMINQYLTFHVRTIRK